MTAVRAEVWLLLRSCFWLLVPVLLVNALLTGQLPPMYRRQLFWSDIPAVVTYGENILRVLLIATPLLIPLSLSGRLSRIGLAVYLAGTAAYLAAWFALTSWPHSTWSTSAAGLLAIAYTPLVWAIGIGLIGPPRHVPVAVAGWLYPAIAVAFTGFHLTHALIVYGRI